MTTPSPQTQLKAAAERRTVKSLRAQSAAQTVVANATVTTQKQQEFANIAENTFYKVMFDPALDQEQKKAEFEAALTYNVNESEADNKARMAEFVEFSAYLQEIRKKMALELIGLTETEAFADIKNVFETIGKEFIDFEKLLAPLTEGLEAINTLRMEDKAVEAVTEIHNSRKTQEDAKAAQAAAAEAAKQEKLTLEQAISATRLKIGEAQVKKGGFLGFGGKIDEAAVNAGTLELQAQQATLAEIEARIKVSPSTNGGYVPEGDFAKEKEALAKLMNLSGKEHKERQEKLIVSARNFVGYIDTNLGTGIVRLEALSEQIGKLSNTNGHLLDCYGIMTDAASAAGKANLELARSFDKPAVGTEEVSDEPVPESMMAQRTRQKNGLAVKGHIGDLTRLGTATGQTFGQLMQQSGQLQVMREKNENQIGEARQMRSAGSAAVADNLVTVLQAINNAALGEVTANTHTYMTRMNAGTRKVLASEFMGLVVDQVGANNRAMQELEAIAEAGSIVNETNAMLRQGMQESRKFTTELSMETARLRETLDGFATLQAEVNAGEDTTATPVSAPETSKAPAPAGGPLGLRDPFATRAPFRGPILQMM